MKFSFSEAGDNLVVMVDLGEANVTNAQGAVAMLGKKAKIKIVVSGHAKHKYSRGMMGGQREVFESGEVEIVGGALSFVVPRAILDGYNYQGKYLNIAWRVELFIDGVLAKSGQIDKDVDGKLVFPLVKPLVTNPINKDGSDKISVWKIFLAFPWWKKLFLLLVFLVFGAFVTLFVLVQKRMVAFLFAESFSMFGIFFTIGVALMLFTHAHDYLKANLVAVLPKIGAASKLKAGDLFEAKALVNLSHLTVLVRGQAVEKGKFRSNDRHGKRITSFHDGVNDLIILREDFALLERGRAIEQMINKVVDFGELYKHISPKMSADADYGVDFQVTLEFWTADYPDMILTIPRETFEEPELKK